MAANIPVALQLRPLRDRPICCSRRPVLFVLNSLVGSIAAAVVSGTLPIVTAMSTVMRLLLGFCAIA